jgi:hypothetical protein
MIKLSPALASLAFIAAVPATAAAADLYEGGYAVDGVVGDEAPVVVERERIIERRYYPGTAYVEVDPEVEVFEPYPPGPYGDPRYWRAGEEW